MATTTDSSITLTDGTDFDWTDTPEQFRHILDKRQTLRLVKNSYDTFVWSYTFGDIRVVKGNFSKNIADLPDHSRIAAIFNGITLVILGRVD